MALKIAQGGRKLKRLIVKQLLLISVQSSELAGIVRANKDKRYRILHKFESVKPFTTFVLF